MTMVYCSKCGSKNPDDAVYCSECGEKLEGTSSSNGETLLEMIHVAWNKGAVPPRKVLYFTDKNIYIAEGTFLVGMGFGAGGLIGHAIEKRDLAKKEEESKKINFQELAAQNEDVGIIPYNEILKLVMGKKRMMLNPSITIETTSTDYKFTVMQGKKYKQYQKSIPAILGDKVIVE